MSDNIERIFEKKFPGKSRTPPQYWIGSPKLKINTPSNTAFIQAVATNPDILDVHDVRRPKLRNQGKLKLVADDFG